MIDDLRSYLAAHLPTATVSVSVMPSSADEMHGRTLVTVSLPLTPDWSGIAPRPLRKSGHSPQIVAAVVLGIHIPDDASRVAALRHKVEPNWALSWAQWRQMHDVDFAALVATLRQHAEDAQIRNATRIAAAEERPENRAALAQMARESAILGEFPTAQVDAWIVHRMGYSPDELAGWGKSTRRDRRREARRQMRAERET